MELISLGIFLVAVSLLGSHFLKIRRAKADRERIKKASREYIETHPEEFRSVGHAAEREEGRAA